MILTDILNRERVKVPLTSADKAGVIEELVDVLAACGGLKARAGALAAVLEREKTRTTGIGYGVAIPHGKCDAVTGLVMAVGRAAQPVDFQSIDGQPVSLVMLILSPLDKVGPHIQALARISRLVSIDAVRKRMIAAATADELFAIIMEQEQTAT